VLSYEHRMASVAVDFTGSGTGQALVDAGYGSPTVGTGYFQLSEACPYNFGTVTETLAEVPYQLHTGTWRSVYSAQARTAEEIIVDELAGKMGKDPVAFRRALLGKSPRARAVLDLAAKEAGWRSLGRIHRRALFREVKQNPAKRQLGITPPYSAGRHRQAKPCR